MSSDAALVAERAALSRRGVMLIIASPSGAGKSTLTRALLKQDRQIELSVSVTTRPRRSSEVDGVHYHFKSPKAFEAMRAAGDLLEWAEVHGNLYGTPREPVETALAAGRDILFDVDYQGARQLYDAMRDDIVSVFILPPSAAELKARLERRAEDPPDVIHRRLKTALVELSHWDQFDHIVVNDDLDRSFRVLTSILEAARHSRARLEGLAGFTRTMQNDISDLLQD